MKSESQTDQIFMERERASNCPCIRKETFCTGGNMFCDVCWSSASGVALLLPNPPMANIKKGTSVWECFVWREIGRRVGCIADIKAHNSNFKWTGYGSVNYWQPYQFRSGLQLGLHYNGIQTLRKHSCKLEKPISEETAVWMLADERLTLNWIAVLNLDERAEELEKWEMGSKWKHTDVLVQEWPVPLIQIFTLKLQIETMFKYFFQCVQCKNNCIVIRSNEQQGSTGCGFS